jgi:hypothetical protein
MVMAEENVPKTMFIVKAKPESLQTAENWLKGKGWVIEATDQIKDALPKILAMKPQFIVLCMDHSNQKIRMLPKLFEQAFQTKVIAYLEGTSPSSLATISGMEYVLYPPITGTAIDRMSSKVERDRRRKQQMEEQRAANGMGKASLGTTDSGVIAIKGSAHKKEDAVIAEQAKKALMSMAGGDMTSITSSGSASAAGDDKFKTGSGIAASAEAGSSMSATSGGLGSAAGALSDASGNLNNFFDDQGSANTPNIKANASKEPEKDPKAKTATSLNAVNMSSQSSVASTTPGTGVSDADVEAAVRAMMEDAKKKEAEAKAGKDVSSRAKESGGVSGFFKKARTLFSRTNEKAGYTESTGIVAGTQKAIDELAEEIPDTLIHPLKETTHAICFFVMSKNHQGFVVCSIAHNTEPLIQFVDMFKNRLTEFMAGFDKNFLTSSALEVTLKEVNFDDWATEQAAFSKKFVHRDRECGIAFFELSPPKPDVAPSTNKEFVQMRLMDVIQDRKLGFNMFLHLPINKKFILYTRRGDKFAGAQKNRLMSRGVSDVHLYESEIDQMHRTHLEAYLDEMIKAHYETRAKQTAVSG